MRSGPKALLVAAILGLLFTALRPARAQTLKTLYNFTGGADGGNPYFGDLLMDAKGNLYGTTFAGGAYPGLGVVFEATRTGTETVLFTFSYTDGCSPYAGLIQDAKGNLFGTTGGCGAYNYGTVFEVASKNTGRVLYNFTGGADGGQPMAGLIQDAQGNLYGTTYEGGDSGCSSQGCGTVFKVTLAGKETVLHTFSGGADGEYPFAGLLEDAGRNLYGTTAVGGSSGGGTVFKVTPSNTEKILFTFNFADGAGPGGLVLDAAENFYGTTSAGGGYGTIFELTKDGAEKVLYSFSGASDGAVPYGVVVMDPEGNLLGTTSQGAGTGCGGGGCGTVFKLTPAGKLVVLHTFTGGDDGGNPEAGLVMDKEGNFFGTTSEGGTYGYGTIFKLTP